MNKFFNTIFGIIAISFLVINIIISPPRYVTADNTTTEFKTEDNETAQALFTWEQDSWNLLQVFHFFPSKRQLCLYNEELDEKWELDEISIVNIPKTLPISFTIPLWKYWSASITLILSLFLIYLIYILKSFYNYKIAEKENTFNSYKNYLLRLMLPNFMRKIAGKKLKSKMGTYKEFLKVVTHKTSGELKDVIFEIIDSIAETGNIKVNLQVESINNRVPQKEFLQKQSELILEKINDPIDSNEYNQLKKSQLKIARLKNNEKLIDLINNKLKTVEDFKNLLRIQNDDIIKKSNYNYEDLSESFSTKKTVDRKYLYAEYLDEIFKVIFPEKMIKIENEANSLVTFHLKSTIDNKNTFQFWRKDEGKNLTDIMLLPDIKCSWEFYVSIKKLDPNKKEYVSKKISSSKFYSIPNIKDTVEDYYMFIFTSSFAKFTKEIAEAFGMAKESNLKKSNNTIEPVDLYHLFEGKMSDYLAEQSGEIPTSLIEEFYGDYQSSLDGLLIDDEYLDLLYEGLEGAMSIAKEVYEGIDFVKETIQDS